ncbi:MAG TPA: hypothetical protein VGE74_17965 [Gemmata sp.]
MKSLVLSALLLLLLGAPVRADVPRPPPPPPPPPPGAVTAPVVAGTATAIGLALAGLWLVRSRRRAEPRGLGTCPP